MGLENMPNYEYNVGVQKQLLGNVESKMKKDKEQEKVI